MVVAAVKTAVNTLAAGKQCLRLNDMRRAGMIEFVDRKILLKHPAGLATA